ncbi:MAG: shikimate dehydrogenase [Patescibacteria group bacterium]
MHITAKTKVCGIIGDPVDHSLSPVIHNAAFEALGLDFIYAAFPVKDVEAAVKGMRSLGVRGLNVTVPHKQTVIPFLDALDDHARSIGAVNTIVNEEGRLKGYNTDAPGFMSTLRHAIGEVKGEHIVVLGAGGAARAIVYALLQADAYVSILNRTADKAQALAREFGAHAAGSLDDLSSFIAATDILVNATSIGLPHGVQGSPVRKELLRKGLVVYDIVYSAKSTPLTKLAREAGCFVIPGTEMLLETAILSFTLFTGCDAPVKVMKMTLNEITKKQVTNNHQYPKLKIPN